MIQKQDYYRLLEHYFNNKMMGKELEWFEKEVNNNRTLALDLRLEKQINQALVQQDIIDLRSKLLKAREKSRQTFKLASIPVFGDKKYMAAAAVGIMLMMSGGYYLTHNYFSTKETLFEQYFTAEPYRDTKRSDSQVASEGIVYYNNKQYTQALIIFEKLLKNNPQNIAFRFYSGISYIETGNLPKAISYFQMIIENGDNLYIEHAEWYLGLSYLKAGDTIKAQKLFATIASHPSHYFREQAEKILKKTE
jgi:tetratricopeptide (TPR) repeat protein